MHRYAPPFVQGRFLLLPFSWLQDDPARWLLAVSDFLDVSVEPRWQNVRRRRSGPRLQDMAWNDTKELRRRLGPWPKPLPKIT